MKSISRQDGFTLIEVIIAVALVAIMAVAVAPPLVQNIKQGKITRAQNDAQTLGTAFLNYYKDIGEWPTHEGATALTIMAGNGSLGGGRAGIPAGSPAVPGSENWAMAASIGDMSRHLTGNKPATTNPLMISSQNPNATSRWNSPYTGGVPLDPWGNAYLVAIKYGQPALTGTTTEDYDKHNIMVLSAGPNKIIETPLDDTVFDEIPGGDDIGYMVQRASRF